MEGIFQHSPFKGLFPSSNGRLGSLSTSLRPLPLSLTPYSLLSSHCLPPTPYHNASRRAKVELNDKSILPSQEGDPGGRYKEEWPWDHWFIWLPPRGQDTEDFQLLLGLELTIRTERKGKGLGRVTLVFPGPELLYPKWQTIGSTSRNPTIYSSCLEN